MWYAIILPACTRFYINRESRNITSLRRSPYLERACFASTYADYTYAKRCGALFSHRAN